MGVYSVFAVSLLTKDGHEPETTLFHRSLRGTLRPDDPQMSWMGNSVIISLEPGKSFTMMIDLTRLYQITEPGVYTLRLSRYHEASNATVHSNTLTIKIEQ